MGPAKASITHPIFGVRTVVGLLFVEPLVAVDVLQRVDVQMILSLRVSG